MTEIQTWAKLLYFHTFQTGAVAFIMSNCELYITTYDLTKFQEQRSENEERKTKPRNCQEPQT